MSVGCLLSLHETASSRLQRQLNVRTFTVYGTLLGGFLTTELEPGSSGLSTLLLFIFEFCPL